MTGLSKKILSMKVGVCVFFELAKDQFGQSQATSTKLVKYEQKQIFFIYIPIKSYNICYKLHYTTSRNTLQYKLHYTTYKNDSTILLQRCPEEQKTMSTPRPLNI